MSGNYLLAADLGQSQNKYRMDVAISILLPTRKRVALLEKSLRSLLRKARRPGSIEIIVAYDHDDQQSRDYFTGPSWPAFLNEVRARGSAYEIRRYGYGKLHLYVNYLASKASGQWMLFWNDDALMETENWDDHVHAQGDWVGLLHMTASNMPMDCSIFPLFHRRWVEIFGMVTPVNPADSWISDICYRARRRKVIPVQVFHDRYQETGQNFDETYTERLQIQDWNQQYYLPQFQSMRTAWVEKLKAILGPA